MSKDKVKVSTLKHYLNDSSKADLIAEIVDLFNKFPVVQSYYQARLSPLGDVELSEKYKAIIKHEFFPERGYGKAKLSVARKAVQEFKKVAGTSTLQADLMIFYVEMGVKFTNAYGDIDEPFYISMESMYQSAVEFICQHQLQALFQKRCYKIVTDTTGIGWGFHDMLTEIYEEHFNPA